MAWTYSGSPSTSSKDAVRYLVGDTNTDDSYVTNEEIEWALEMYSNVFEAAALVASNLSTYFATQAEQIKVGPLVEIFNKRAILYASVASKLEIKASKMTSISFVCGGVTTADALPASFYVGIHDFALSDSTE